MSIDTSFTKVR